MTTTPPPPPPERVTIVGIAIPFWSLVGVIWSIGAAGLVTYLLASLLGGLITAGVAALAQSGGFR